MGYVCGVPDGTIPGYTIWDCMDLGYSGALAGCVDPQCTGWRPSIPGCGAQVWQQLESSDPNVVQALPWSPDDPMIYGGTAKKSCCCGDSAGPSVGLGGPAVAAASGAGSSAAACCGSDWSFFGLPWWIIVLIVILVVRMKK